MTYFALRGLKDLDRFKWEPYVPDNSMTRGGYEDRDMKRLCFCPTIGLCLTALGRSCGSSTYQVYMLDDPDAKFYKPNAAQLPDCAITQEVWVLNDVKVRYLGAVRVVSPYVRQSATYKYGAFEAETFYWDYEWVEGPIDWNGGFII